MNNERAVEETLAALRESLQEKHAFQRAHALSERTGQMRRERVAARYREKILAQALEAAGIDREEFLKRHQLERESWMRFRDEQEQLVLEHAPARAERQQAVIDQHVKMSEGGEWAKLPFFSLTVAHKIVPMKVLHEDWLEGE